MTLTPEAWTEHHDALRSLADQADARANALEVVDEGISANIKVAVAMLDGAADACAVRATQEGAS